MAKKKNIKLLKRLRTRFLRMRHPKHFYMGDVAQKNECGTAMCIAGHTLDLLGYKVRFDEDNEPQWFRPNGRPLGERGEIYTPMHEAQRKLGLTAIEAQDDHGGLFYDMTLKTPKQAAKRIEQLIAEG